MINTKTVLQGYCNNCAQYRPLEPELNGCCSQGCYDSYTELIKLPPPKGIVGFLLGYQIYLEIARIRKEIDILMFVEKSSERIFYAHTPQLSILAAKEGKLYRVFRKIINNERLFFGLLKLLVKDPSEEVMRKVYYRYVAREER
jgi:hypothetical protein